MPTTIPYDPSLALGNLVNEELLEQLNKISAEQAKVDAAEDVMNSYISMKRSIDMTIQELIGMSIDTTKLIETTDDIKKNIKDAAGVYADAKLDAEKKIQQIKANSHRGNSSFESPIDYNKTQIKKMPLSADSLKMNVQYFSNDENNQASGTQASTVKNFISDQTSILGDSFSGQASTAASNQINSQYSNHSIAGTLIVAVTCTHKDAVLLAPFILDVDKAIRVWNKIYTDDLIETDSKTSMAKIAAQADTLKEKSLTLLSGATYGSCFIGMVHVLNTSSTIASETMYSVASSVQEQLTVSAWFANESGGFGVDESFSNDTRNLLSAQNISSHCTLTTIGSIPSIKSNNVKMGVQQFSDFDGAAAMTKLAALQTATAGDKTTVDSAANQARAGAQMLSMENSKVTAVLSGLAEIDDGQNKMIDINSMMDALDDYIQKALDGNIGAPINYYLKPITKSELAEMWVAKYFPNKLTVTSGDDNPPTGGGTATPNVDPIS
jgi:hypothetical protein